MFDKNFIEIILSAGLSAVFESRYCFFKIMLVQ